MRHNRTFWTRVCKFEKQTRKNKEKRVKDYLYSEIHVCTSEKLQKLLLNYKMMELNMEQSDLKTESFMPGFLCTTGEPLFRPADKNVAWHPSLRLNTLHLSGVLPDISSMLPTPKPTPPNKPRKKLTPKKSKPKKEILDDESSAPVISTPRQEVLAEAEDMISDEVIPTPASVTTPHKFPANAIDTPTPVTPSTFTSNLDTPNLLSPSPSPATTPSSATTPSNATTPKGGRLRKEQINKLEMEYALNKHPNKKEKNEMSERLDIPYNKITTWFQSQRNREKRQSSASKLKENIEESVNPTFVEKSDDVKQPTPTTSVNCNLEDQFTEVMERPPSNLIDRCRVTLAPIDDVNQVQ